MNSSKDDPPGDPPDVAKGGAEKDPSLTKSSGRASFDSRGNAVWEWRTDDTGKFTTEASTTVLKKLEASELAIEATLVVKPSEQLEAKDAAKAGGGFNPYDRGAVNKEKKAVKPPAAPTKPGARVPVTPPPVSTKGARSLGERIREALEAFRDRRK